MKMRVDFLLVKKGVNLTARSTKEEKLTLISEWNLSRLTVSGSARLTGCCVPALKMMASTSGYLVVMLWDRVAGQLTGPWYGEHL